MRAAPDDDVGGLRGAQSRLDFLTLVSPVQIAAAATLAPLATRVAGRLLAGINFADALRGQVEVSAGVQGGGSPASIEDQLADLGDLLSKKLAAAGISSSNPVAISVNAAGQVEVQSADRAADLRLLIEGDPEVRDRLVALAESNLAAEQADRQLEFALGYAANRALDVGRSSVQQPLVLRLQGGKLEVAA